MENMFNTDSGLRPPSPLNFAPGHSLFGEPLAYEDFRFPNQDFLNMPASPALGTSSAGASSSSSSLPPPPLLPPGLPQNGMMMNMMAMPDPNIPLFHPSEQRYFSEFLDTLVVDQDFTFDPSAIPNLPAISLFSSDPIPGLDNSVNNTNNPYMIPPTTTSSSSISTGANATSAVEPQRHSVGTSMDFDIAGLYNNNNNSNGSALQSGSQQSMAAPAKRTKTSKTTSTSADLPVRKGTPSNAETGNRIATPMSKLSLNNSQASQANGSDSSSGPSKSKKNKREQEDEDEKRDEGTQSSPGSNNRRPQHQHRSSTSSATSASSRSQSQTQSHARHHERNNSLSDDYTSDGAAATNGNGTNGSAANGSSVDQANTSSTSTTPTPKRKPYKDLLTEEEKRANHIASEQKRRNTIRNGFKDMTEIIPDLKDVNSSKSTILFKAVDFIKYLERRNRSLQEKAHQLEARLHLQKGSQMQQQQIQQHQQPFGMHHLQQQQQQQQQQHMQHQYQQQHHNHHQQHHHQQSHHQHQIFHNPGLDDKRFQEIPSVYPVAISR